MKGDCGEVHSDLDVIPHQLAVSLDLATVLGSYSQNNEYNSIIELSLFVIVIDFVFPSLLLQDDEFFEGRDYILLIFISPEPGVAHDL